MVPAWFLGSATGAPQRGSGGWGLRDNKVRGSKSSKHNPFKTPDFAGVTPNAPGREGGAPDLQPRLSPLCLAPSLRGPCG